MRGPTPGARRSRYVEVAEASGAFQTVDGLWAPVLWQMWLDHLLALSSVQGSGRFAQGRFVLLAPAGNLACQQSTAAYRTYLTSPGDLLTLSIEDLLAILVTHSDASWVHALCDRYGDLGRLLAAGWPSA